MTIPNEVQQMLDDKECKILLTFSGGKDSVAMVLRMLDLGIDKSRIEASVVVDFNTGRRVRN